MISSAYFSAGTTKHTKSVYMFSAFQADLMCWDEIIGFEVSKKNDGLLGNSRPKFRQSPSWYCEEFAWINVKEFEVTHTHTQFVSITILKFKMLETHSKCWHVLLFSSFEKKSLHLCLKADNDKRNMYKEKQTKIKITINFDFDRFGAICHFHWKHAEFYAMIHSFLNRQKSQLKTINYKNNELCEIESKFVGCYVFGMRVLKLCSEAKRLFASRGAWAQNAIECASTKAKIEYFVLKKAKKWVRRVLIPTIAIAEWSADRVFFMLGFSASIFWLFLVLRIF